MNRNDFIRAKELAQQQEDWLKEQYSKNEWDHHDLTSAIKVFLYALEAPSFYKLSLQEEEFDFIADGLFDFVSTLD